MEAYNYLSTLELKMEWLTQYGTLVPKKILLANVLRAHTINNLDEIDEIEPQRIFVKTWLEIKELIANYLYEKYVAFVIDPITSNITDLELINAYTNTRVCYSIPLFLAIKDVQNVDDTTEFQFVRAMINGKESIFIKVDSHRTICSYNMSDDPK